jgi:hypothetical protein
MAFVRRSTLLVALIALAAVIATTRISNAQIMDPGTPPRGAVAFSPDLESASAAPALRLDDFLVERTMQLRLAAMHWLGNASRSAVKTRPTLEHLRTRSIR